MSRPILTAVGFAVFATSPLWGQQPPPSDISKMSPSAAPDIRGMSLDGSAHAMESMESHHLDMGPHMKMTTVRALQPGDQEKAGQVVAAARKVAEKYTDYRLALADGFKIFMPERPQKQYHFTNYE